VLLPAMIDFVACCVFYLLPAWWSKCDYSRDFGETSRAGIYFL